MSLFVCVARVSAPQKAVSSNVIDDSYYTRVKAYLLEKGPHDSGQN